MERTTNHDVKAIEYVLKDRFKDHDTLSKVCSASLKQQKLSVPALVAAMLLQKYTYADNCTWCT